MQSGSNIYPAEPFRPKYNRDTVGADFGREFFSLFSQNFGIAMKSDFGYNSCISLDHYKDNFCLYKIDFSRMGSEIGESSQTFLDQRISVPSLDCFIKLRVPDAKALALVVYACYDEVFSIAKDDQKLRHLTVEYAL